MGIRSLLRRKDVVVHVNVPTVESVLGLSPEDLYSTQPALRSVISFLADNLGHLPLKCYLKESETNRKADDDSTLARLLRRPNKDTTAHELMRDTASDVLLWGWAAWLVIPDADSSIGWSITHIPTSWFTQWPTIDGFHPCMYKFTNPDTSKTVEVDASDIIRFYNYGTKGPMYPESPVNALRQIIAEQVSAWNYRNSIWKNGGRVSAWISRPADAPDWVASGARERFVKSWKAKFSGEEGSDTGGTPLLEDGMKLETTQFNAREAQWLETTKLSHEEVAGVYHLNHSLLWHSEGQTYASAKENARALYCDTLGPTIDMFEERITEFLVEKIGADPKSYVEFDLSAKLSGSFEERASVIQSSVGRPWMCVNEARAMSNLPAIDGGDELAMPLNVAVGGLASPNDTDPTVERYNARELAQAIVTAQAEVKAKERGDPVALKSRGKAETKASMELAALLRKFFKRQARSVISAIDSAKDRGVLQKAEGDSFPEWWDAERWDKELAEDLEPLFVSQATTQAKKTLGELELEPDDFDPDSIAGYMRAMAKGKAHAINNVTYRQLEDALDENLEEDAEGATPKGVFDKAEESRADRSGVSFATAVAGWAVLEAVRQQAPSRGAMKTWIVTSGNPRPEHAALDGETVAYDDEFSNGAQWPGDQVLTPEESCNCQCEVEITI